MILIEAAPSLVTEAKSKYVAPFRVDGQLAPIDANSQSSLF
jgi:hypothetical protein